MENLEKYLISKMKNMNGEELAEVYKLANMIPVVALAQVLIDKGIIEQKEYDDKLQDTKYLTELYDEIFENIKENK